MSNFRLIEIKEAPCAVCNKSSQNWCATCQNESYCCVEHQREMWSKHRPHCAGFDILSNDKVGRYGAASRDLKAGEIVMIESAVTVGPKSSSPVLCLGCYSSTDSSVLCRKCKWPLCRIECEESPDHSINECKIFQENEVAFQPVDNAYQPCSQYECITVLRVLLSKDRDLERWNNEVMKMESHDDKRRGTPDWNAEHVNIVKFIQERLKLANRFSEDEIHKVCGILEVNCFEICTASGNRIRGLYPRAAILSHNCVANTTHSILTNCTSSEGPAENYSMILRSTVPVSKGAEVFSSYTHCLDPTIIRREKLRLTKYFDCNCKRCSDPQELGSNLGSLKCNKCDSGIIVSLNPLEQSSQWKCTTCSFSTSSEAVRKVFDILQNEIDSLDITETDHESGNTIEAREKLIKKYRAALHPKNAYLISVKHSLAMYYGRVVSYTMEDLPDILLEHKVNLCKEVLAVVDIVEPGLTRLRGTLLYEMQSAMMLLFKNEYLYKIIDNEGLKRKLGEVVNILEEVITILGLEPDGSQEKYIAFAAEEALKQLKASIVTLETKINA